jgi:transporter family protein
MNTAILYALVAMVSYGVSDFIYKQAAAAGIRADHFLMAQAWFFCPLVVLYALATRTLVLDPAALWGLLAGAFVFIGFYYFSRSLAAGSVSTNASIFRLNFIVTAVLAITLLGEPLTLAKAAGLVLALLATWLLVGAGSGADPAPHSAGRRSLMQVAVATLAFGAANFFHAVGLRHGAVPETLAVAQAALFMPLATAVVYTADRKLAPPSCCWRPPSSCCAAWRGGRRACSFPSPRWVSSSPRCSASWCCANAFRCARRWALRRPWRRSPCWREVDTALSPQSFKPPILHDTRARKKPDPGGPA